MHQDALLYPQAAFLMRASLGIMFIAHSLYLKLFIFTLPGTAAFFVSIGLPGPMAYLIFALEALGGVMLLVGYQARWAALLLVPVLAGATWAHWGSGWMFANEGGGWEYPAFLTVSSLVVFLLGDGAYALKRSSSIPMMLRERLEPRNANL